MSGVYLPLEGIAGARAEECAAELARIAAQLGIMTSLKFNGDLMLANPGDTPAQVHAFWRNQADFRAKESARKASK